MKGAKRIRRATINNQYVNDFIDMRQAIARSDNIYAVNTIMKVGPEKVIEMARKLGIDSPDEAAAFARAGHVPCQSLRNGFRLRHLRESRVRVSSRRLSAY